MLLVSPARAPTNPFLRVCAVFALMAAGMIKGMKEVEEMLLYNIAQGRLNERGNYAVKLSPKNVQAEDGVVKVEEITSKTVALPDGVEVTPSPSELKPSASTS